MHMQMHDVLQHSGQQVQCHGLLHCNECRPFVITRPFCHHRRAVSMGTGPGHPLATGHRVYNVNVNNLLAISRLDFDNSGEPGPQAKGVTHLETPLRQLHATMSCPGPAVTKEEEAQSQQHTPPFQDSPYDHGPVRAPT